MWWIVEEENLWCIYDVNNLQYLWWYYFYRGFELKAFEGRHIRTWYKDPFEHLLFLKNEN
jgi:hypothetical protein